MQVQGCPSVAFSHFLRNLFPENANYVLQIEREFSKTSHQFYEYFVWSQYIFERKYG